MIFPFVRIQHLLLVILCTCLLFIFGYETPRVRIEVFYPKGFRVSIPAEEGVTLFAFHGKINEKFEVAEAGTWNVDIVKVRDGRYSYTNETEELKIGDTLYFWTYVIHNGLGYREDNGEFRIEGYINGTEKNKITTLGSIWRSFSSQFKPEESCKIKSVTQVNGNQVCPGTTIFEDDFNTLNTTKWQKERRFYAEPDYGFAFYLSEDRNVFIENGILNIRPIRTEDFFHEEFIYENHTIQIGCTGKPDTAECTSLRTRGYLMEPLISGRLNTANSFKFTYGKIEIKAKVPFEDWIFPQMILEPVIRSNERECESGQMRVAITRGTDGELYGGALLSPKAPARNLKLCKCDFNEQWHTDFHVYSLEWTPDEIKVYVDNQLYCEIDPGQGFSDLKINEKSLDGSTCWNSKMAPFDKDFYLTLGVGVGGHNDFPDDGHWKTKKPWTNYDVPALTYFWHTMKPNLAWPSDAATLKIDYIRVKAI